MTQAISAFEPMAGDERLNSSVISDALDSVGLRTQVLPRRLAPLRPLSRGFGRAATMQFAPSLAIDEEGPYDGAIDFIDSLSGGEMVVIATGESNQSAFWGELFSAAAIGHKAAGVVTDGNLRDTDKIANLGFPAFSNSRRPIDFRGRMRPVASHESVVIGGVRVDPGDLVMADDDGVVIVPRSHEDEVLRIARDRVAKETTVLAELLDGETMRSVWERHRVL